MKVIYIAGPFRGSNAWAVECNIRRAEKVAFEVAEMGLVPLCPHTMTRFFNGTLTDAYWLAATMELLRRCDAILLLPCWQSSSGSVAERAEARRLGLPVLHFRSWATDHGIEEWQSAGCPHEWQEDPQEADDERPNESDDDDEEPEPVRRVRAKMDALRQAGERARARMESENPLR